MSAPSSGRALLFGLSASLVAALLAIAFLLGRESARAPAPQAGAPAAPVLGPEPEALVDTTEQRRWPEWADLREWEDIADQDFVEEAVGERVELRSTGSSVGASRNGAADMTQATSASGGGSTGSAVSDYFLRTDLVRSESGAGDPNTFAMSLIKAGLGGSTAEFDLLIADTQRMEKELREVTPPPSCQGYHEANLKALAGSREILEQMKDAFVSRDFAALAAIAQRAGALQHDAEALEEMRKRIIADADR